MEIGDDKIGGVSTGFMKITGAVEMRGVKMGSMRIVINRGRKLRENRVKILKMRAKVW